MQVFTFRLPDNLTQWRIRLRGSDGNQFLLDYQDSIFTQKELMVQLETPTFLVENDKSILRAIVFNSTHDSLAITIKCIPQKGVVLSSVKEIDTIIHAHSIISTECEISTLNVDNAIISLQVISDKFSDGEQRIIPVKRYAVPMYTGKSLIVQDSATVQLSIPIEHKSFDKKFSFQITPDPIKSMLPSLKYLMAYPHGCVEQTMSRFLPDLYVGKLLDTSDHAYDSLRKVFNKYVNEGLNPSFQLPA